MIRAAHEYAGAVRSFRCWQLLKRAASRERRLLHGLSHFLCQISREILVARTSQRHCPDTRREVLDEKAFGVGIA